MFSVKTFCILPFGVAVLAAGAVLFAPAALSSTGSTPAQVQPAAQPTKAPRSRSEVEAVRSGTRLVVASSEASCPRLRRRLWIEGEGWVVRRVALCS